MKNNFSMAVLISLVLVLPLCQLSADESNASFSFFSHGGSMYLLDRDNGRVWVMSSKDDQRIMTPVLFNSADGFFTLFPPTQKEDLTTESSLKARREQVIKETQKKLLEQKLKEVKAEAEEINNGNGGDK